MRVRDPKVGYLSEMIIISKVQEGQSVTAENSKTTSTSMSSSFGEYSTTSTCLKDRITQSYNTYA